MATPRGSSNDATNTSLTSDMGRLVRDTAKKQIDTQKDRATDALGQIARAVRQTTEQMNDGPASTVARYANRAADQIDHWSADLRNRDLTDFARDIRRFAREQPALFLGAAFGLGVLAARFLKSSGEHTTMTSGRDEPEWAGATQSEVISSTTARPYVAHDTADTIAATPRRRNLDHPGE